MLKKLTPELKEKLLSRCHLESTITEDNLVVALKFDIIEISTVYKLSDISNLELKWGMDVNDFTRNLLFNELVNNNKVIEKIIKLENREKNLNILTDEDTI